MTVPLPHGRARQRHETEGPIAGVTVSNQGPEWVIQYDGLNLLPSINATGNLVLSGTLTLVEVGSEKLVVSKDELEMEILPELEELSAAAAELVAGR